MDAISAHQTAQEAATLVSVAKQMGNNINNKGTNTSISINNKKPASAKKGPTKKGKSAKQLLPRYKVKVQ